jgi:8-oxo-dGTP pyrophosphatase MutT (NUDIX family)
MSTHYPFLARRLRKLVAAVEKIFMTDQAFNLKEMARTLDKHDPALKYVCDRGHAAVAMVLRNGQHTPEVLFIIRAKHEQDPWSGNIAFPGGRLNTDGETAKEAAERETLEELALDLKSSFFLGQLDDLYGAIMPVLVSCFVYHVEGPVDLQLNHEIESSFWCPLPKLLDEERHRQETFYYRGMQRTHPVVDLLDQQQPVLWGITYRLIRNFFFLCGHQFGTQDPMLTRVE